MKTFNTKDIAFKPSYILLYGPSGIGKTSMAATLPQNEVLILDAESGIASLRGTSIDSIPLARTETGEMIPEEARLERLKEFMAFVQRPEVKAKYKFIYIDSLTEIAQNVLKRMQQEHDGFKAWGEYTAMMQAFLKFFRDLGHYTVIVTALEGHIDGDDGLPKAFPDIGGKKIKEYLMPAFDECYRMIVDAEKNRKLVTKTTARTQAKTRSKALAELEEPNLFAILGKIREEAKQLAL